VSKMVKAIKSLFSGGGSSSQAATMRQQEAAIRSREREVEATAAAQRRARTSNRGLLAYVDEQLSSTFGGG